MYNYSESVNGCTSLIRVIKSTTKLATVYNGGIIYVENGGKALSTAVMVDGNLSVSSGGTASNTTLEENGLLEVFSDGEANSTVISSGGSLNISGGGIANSNTVLRNGTVNLYSGGTANNNTISSDATLNVLKGGILTGTLQIENGGTVDVKEGGIIDFTVANQAQSSTALINKCSSINGGNDAVYTLTVKPNQYFGTYVLAGGAENFNQSITVSNTEGTTLGTLTVNDDILTLADGKIIYSLKKNASDLVLTISEERGKPIQNINGSKTKLSWDASDASGYIIQYSTDNFAHAMTVTNWNEKTLTYTDGNNSVKVTGVTAADITLRFGREHAWYNDFLARGAYNDFTSENIFEESQKGLLA